MKNIVVIIPDGQSNLSTIASVVGAYEIFTRANVYCQKTFNRAPFTITLAGISAKTEIYNGVFSIQPHTHISKIAKARLILIPSLTRDYQNTLAGNQQLVNWIEKQYKEGAEIASMCTGAFLLASSGLLNGKSCSTHWSAVNTFKNMFPKINVQPEKLITDENGIYTNGGGYSFLNLVIYLVEKYFNRQTAIYCSKIFQIEIDRQNQSAFVIFKGQKEHEDEMIREAQIYIENNLREKINIEDLSSKFFISRRNFDRRFIKATGNTPVEYIQRVKIEFAKKAFETTRKTINEVMYEVGYTDEKAFREVFRKITGMSPVGYKNKYNKELYKWN